jgi:hypothetical protein
MMMTRISYNWGDIGDCEITVVGGVLVFGIIKNEE